MDKLIALIFMSLFAFGVVVVFSLFGAIVTQWAWEGSVAQIFHLPGLSIWQAFWLNLLGGMVCKSSSLKLKD